MSVVKVYKTDTVVQVRNATGVAGGASTTSVTSPITNSGSSTNPVIGINQSLLAIAPSQVTGTAVVVGDPIVVLVRNATGATLTRGQVVYLSGANGTHVQVSLAQANSETTSARSFGFVQDDIANNASGYVVTEGYLENVDTSGLTAGQALYLSGTTAGAWTTTKPSAPTHLVYLGVVARVNASVGRILCKVQNGYELDEIHNVAIATPTDGQALVYESASNLWKNKTVSGGGGTGTVTSITASAPLTGGTITTSGSIGLDQTALAISPSQVTGTAVITTDSRLSDTRTPTNGSVTDAKIVAGGLSTTSISGTAVITTDSRLSNSRTPTAHASSHASAGSDPLTLAQSQITNLTTDLAAKISSTEKGAVNGVATLDSSGLIPQGQLPAVAITSTFVVATQSAMLALTAQEGDVAVRTDLSKSFILVATPASTLANWQELLSPSGGVTAVTGTSPIVSSGGSAPAISINQSLLAIANTQVSGLGTASTKDVPATGDATTAQVVLGTDTRLTNSRTPSTHASTHASGGSDQITVAQSQVTNLTTDLAAKAPTASPTFTGTVTTPLTTAGIVKTSAGGVLSSVATIAESDVTNLVTDLAGKAGTASPTFTGTATFVNVNVADHFVSQPAPTALSAAATLTIAQLLTSIMDWTGSTASNLTLPTGTLTDAGIQGGALPVDYAFDWFVIARGTGAPTIVGGTGHTLVGSGSVSTAQGAGMFRTRKTATNTFITYRIS